MNADVTWMHITSAYFDGLPARAAEDAHRSGSCEQMLEIESMHDGVVYAGEVQLCVEAKALTRPLYQAQN